MMHPDIEKAVELIENKILELQRAKQTLLEAFGEKPISTKIQPLLFSPKKITKRKTGPTRKDAIMGLLEQEGSLSRSEILKRSGIPRGTVATILNDKSTFGSKDGKWYILSKEKGLTDSQ